MEQGVQGVSLFGPWPSCFFSTLHPQLHIGIFFQCNVMIMPHWDSNQRPLNTWDVSQKPKRYVITATIFYFILYIFLQNFGFLACSPPKTTTFHHLSLRFPKSCDPKHYFDISLMNLRSSAPYEKLVWKSMIFNTKFIVFYKIDKNIKVWWTIFAYKS